MVAMSKRDENADETSVPAVQVLHLTNVSITCTHLRAYECLKQSVLGTVACSGSSTKIREYIKQEKSVLNFSPFTFYLPIYSESRGQTRHKPPISRVSNAQRYARVSCAYARREQRQSESALSHEPPVHTRSSRLLDLALVQRVLPSARKLDLVKRLDKCMRSVSLHACFVCVCTVTFLRCVAANFIPAGFRCLRRFSKPLIPPSVRLRTH